MIAEVVPAAQDLATKSDIARLEVAIADLRAELTNEMSGLGKEFGDRMLRFMVPLWVAVFGALGTMIALMVIGR